MKRDPLDMTISLIFHLNLLEKNKTYNINEFKKISNLDFHWNTIFKYLKMFKIIQKYIPSYDLIDSKLHINNTKIFDRLNKKEKFILYLFNRKALNPDNAIEISNKFIDENINKSIGVLYEKMDSGKFYLNEAGLDIYRSIKQNLNDLIFNEKEIDEVFPNLFLEESDILISRFDVNIERLEPNINYNFIFLPERKGDTSKNQFGEITIIKG